MTEVAEFPMPRSSCMHVVWAGPKTEADPRTGKPVTKWITNTCDKITEPGDEYCPHHLLLYREQQGEVDRRMEKARRGKEKRKFLRDMLETSPLAVPVAPKSDHLEAADKTKRSSASA